MPVLGFVMIQEDLSPRDSLLFPKWDQDTNEVKCRQSDRFIDYLFKWRHEETATGKREKDRKERNLASSRDRVARDSHHHGSSGVPLVLSSCVHRW